MLISLLSMGEEKERSYAAIISVTVKLDILEKQNVEFDIRSILENVFKRAGSNLKLTSTVDEKEKIRIREVVYTTISRGSRNIEIVLQEDVSNR